MADQQLENILGAGNKLVVVDGGARNGPQDLVGLHSLCQFHCFEPNPKELAGVDGAVLSRMEPSNGENQMLVYPYALCGSSGFTTLNVSLRPGATSTLEPCETLLNRFAADNFSELKEIVERVEVPAITLSDFMSKAAVNYVDFIKLDTQGNELDILKSADSYLESISVIMTEVELVPLYKNQPLFHDVSAFLDSKGFELIDFRSNPTCRRFHARADLPPSAYRLVWGDAIYAYRPDNVNKPRSLQQGLVLAGLGYADVAIDIFDRHSQLSKEQRTYLERFARKAAEPNWLTGKIKRIMERTLGVLIHRYDWRLGHQVRSMKTTREHA